jgi:hypothetical protein
MEHVERCALIPLTQGYAAEVDPEDYDELRKLPWHVEFMSGKPYATYRLRGKRVWMHRVVARTPDGMRTDHADGNTLNNRRGNLRHATASQNAANSAKRSAAYKGVTRNGKGWAATCGYEGRNVHLGTYPTQERAAVAYDLFAYMAHGEFARLNGV